MNCPPEGQSSAVHIYTILIFSTKYYYRQVLARMTVHLDIAAQDFLSWIGSSERRDAGTWIGQSVVDTAVEGLVLVEKVALTQGAHPDDGKSVSMYHICFECE